MATMVTFIADRLPALNGSLLGIQYRTMPAIADYIFTGWLVNRGPKNDYARWYRLVGVYRINSDVLDTDSWSAECLSGEGRGK